MSWIQRVANEAQVQGFHGRQGKVSTFAEESLRCPTLPVRWYWFSGVRLDIRGR
jgi:hypothetical protein